MSNIEVFNTDKSFINKYIIASNNIEYWVDLFRKQSTSPTFVNVTNDKRGYKYIIISKTQMKFIKQEYLDNIYIVNNKFIVKYLRDSHSLQEVLIKEDLPSNTSMKTYNIEINPSDIKLNRIVKITIGKDVIYASIDRYLSDQRYEAVIVNDLYFTKHHNYKKGDLVTFKISNIKEIC